MKTTYNKSEIFRNAWTIVRSGKSLSEALKAAWAQAKAPKHVFKSAEQHAADILAIDPATNAFADGGVICGYYRGKRSEFFKFMVSSRTFIVNNAGNRVVNAFIQAGLL